MKSVSKANTEMLENNLEKLRNLTITNNEDLRGKLDKEINNRKDEKNKMYEDFEQVCRNIDDRITGEKEKLWEKLNDNTEDLKNLAEINRDNRESLFALINEESMKREN